MASTVDIKQLAVERGTAPAALKKRRGRPFSRYVIPGALILGFASLVSWAMRDIFVPPQRVWVVPVLASQSAAQNEGTPLFQAAGWIEPRPSLIRVAALSQGVVEKLLVIQDQSVKAGQPIAELVKEDAQLACDAARANLNLREAELQESRAALKAAQIRLAQPVHLQAALSEAENALGEVSTEINNLPFEIRRAQAEIVYAEANHEGKLASQGAVAGRQIEEAKSLLDKARATADELNSRTEFLTKQRLALTERRDALKKQLELRTDEIQAQEKAEANIAAATARVEQAQVELAQAQLRLDRMTVRAPVDGRVYQLIAFSGSTLSGGMSPITNADGNTVVTLYQPNSLQVRVDVRFEDIPKVCLNQPVLINNPAVAKPLTGKVLFVSSEANIQKNTLQVKVEIDSEEWVFKPEESKTSKLRKIRITDAEIIKIVREQIERYPHGPIFRNSAGGRWTRQLLTEKFRHAKQRAMKQGMQFDADCCMYSCRHTYAKRILSGYWSGKPTNIETLAILMGNSPQVCRDHYLQWCEHFAEPVWESA